MYVSISCAVHQQHDAEGGDVEHDSGGTDPEETADPGGAAEGGAGVAGESAGSTHHQRTGCATTATSRSVSVTGTGG